MDKHKVKAVSNDTPGGKSAMSEMNPQKPQGFARRGIKVHDESKETWGLKDIPRYEHD